MFEILITSPPDRENLVAEIWLMNELIAEVIHESGDLEIEIYMPQGSSKHKFELEAFIDVLTEAKERLESI